MSEGASKSIKNILGRFPKEGYSSLSLEREGVEF
jgi:hypothetical protein